jgi:hypothetical protein
MRDESPGPFLSAAEVTRIPWLLIDGKPVSERAVRRFMSRKDGLRSTRLFGRRVTCEAWLLDFIDRESGGAAAAAGRSPARRQRQIEQAEAELADVF